VLLHIIAEAALDAAGGLIALVSSVVQIQGDVILKPLPESFSVPLKEDNANFVAVCLRTDHAMVSAGVREDGTWTGSSQGAFVNAFGEMKDHQHPEACIVRCSIDEQTCGVVWVTNMGG